MLIQENLILLICFHKGMRSFQLKWQTTLDLPHPGPITISAKALPGTQKGEKPQS